MIKLMREGARKYPWLLKTLVGRHRHRICDYHGVVGVH